MIIAAPFSAAFRQQLIDGFLAGDPEGTPPAWTVGGAMFMHCGDPADPADAEAFAEAFIQRSGHDPADGYLILDAMPEFDRQHFFSLDFHAELGVTLNAVRAKQIDAHQLRQAKLAAAIAEGYTDGGNTYSLYPASLDNWQKLATSLRAEIAEGETAATDDVTILEAAGAAVELEASAVVALLAKIGKTARLLQTRDLGWQSQIDAATTSEQLDAIIAAIEAA